MPEYAATLSSAQAFGLSERMDERIHAYLRGEGRNVPFSEGLKLLRRYYFSPAFFPAGLFRRCAGPEPGMKYPIDRAGWESRVSALEKSIQADPDMPPLIVHYVDENFELNDGNHRLQAYRNLGVDKVWAIIWITEDAEKDDFLKEYSEYVDGCVVIRR